MEKRKEIFNKLQEYKKAWYETSNIWLAKEEVKELIRELTNINYNNWLSKK